MRPLARLSPLRVCDPLHVLMEEHVIRKIPAGIGEATFFMIAKRSRPLGPGTLALCRVEGAKQRVILDPPRLLGHEGRQRRRTTRLAMPFEVDKPLEGRSQRLTLQPADHAVLNRR